MRQWHETDSNNRLLGGLRMAHRLCSQWSLRAMLNRALKSRFSQVDTRKDGNMGAEAGWGGWGNPAATGRGQWLWPTSSFPVGLCTGLGPQIIIGEPQGVGAITPSCVVKHVVEQVRRCSTIAAASVFSSSVVLQHQPLSPGTWAGSALTSLS